MSIYDTNDIAEWENKQMENKQFKVEKITAANFDENGKETEDWIGYSVKLIDDPANYSFDCRDKINADKLCNFLNDECYINIEDVSIEAFVIDNCIEWSNLIASLSDKEQTYYNLKETYQGLSEEIISQTDFKAIYGKNNDTIRKQHVREELAEEHKEIKELEFEIDYIKRRISYLKALVYVKTSLLGVDNE